MEDESWLVDLSVCCYYSMSVVVVAPANANQRIDSSATTTSSSREDLIKASSTGSDGEVRPQDSQGQTQGSAATPVQGKGSKGASSRNSAGAGAAAAGTPDTPDGKEGDNVSTGTTLTTPGDELPPLASGGGATALTAAPSSGVSNPKSSSSTMDPLMRSSSNHPQGGAVPSDGNGNHNHGTASPGTTHLAPPTGAAPRTGGSTGGRINDAYTSNPDIELQSYSTTTAGTGARVGSSSSGRRKHGVVEFDPPHHGESSCSTTDFNTNNPSCQSHKDSSSYDKNLQLVGLNPVFGSGSGLSTVYEAAGGGNKSKQPGMFTRDRLGGSVDALQVGIMSLFN